MPWFCGRVLARLYDVLSLLACELKVFVGLSERLDILPEPLSVYNARSIQCLYFSLLFAVEAAPREQASKGPRRRAGLGAKTAFLLPVMVINVNKNYRCKRTGRMKRLFDTGRHW